MKYKFKIGDYVEVKENYSIIRKGYRGYIRYFHPFELPPIGIEFDNFNAGHSLKRTLNNRSGYFLYESNIFLVNNTMSQQEAEEFLKLEKLFDGL